MSQNLICRYDLLKKGRNSEWSAALIELSTGTSIFLRQWKNAHGVDCKLWGPRRHDEMMASYKDAIAGKIGTGYGTMDSLNGQQMSLSGLLGHEPLCSFLNVFAQTGKKSEYATIAGALTANELRHDADQMDAVGLNLMMTLNDGVQAGSTPIAAPSDFKPRGERQWRSPGARPLELDHVDEPVKPEEVIDGWGAWA